MVLYLPNFSLVFLIHVFLYAGVYCIIDFCPSLLHDLLRDLNDNDKDNDNDYDYDSNFDY